jgi:hypothetical protein
LFRPMMLIINHQTASPSMSPLASGFSQPLSAPHFAPRCLVIRIVMQSLEDRDESGSNRSSARVHRRLRSTQIPDPCHALHHHISLFSRLSCLAYPLAACCSSTHSLPFPPWTNLVGLCRSALAVVTS